MIEVGWKDHWGATGWQEKGHVNSSTPMNCKSVGYFSGYSKEGDLILGATTDDQSQFNNVQYRLWSAVTKIRRLK